jgi:PAS domain S-box-containing protein
VSRRAGAEDHGVHLGRGLASRATTAYAVFAAAAIVLHFALPRGSTAQALVYQGLNTAAGLAVVAGIRLHRPRPSLHWWLVAAGLLLWGLGDGIWNVYTVLLERDPPYPSVADAVYLSGYAALGAAAVAFARTRTHVRSIELLDALIVGLGAALLSWFLLVEPLAGDTAGSPAGRVVSALYPAFDLLILVAVLRLALAVGRSTPALRLLFGAGVTLLASDVAYSVLSLRGAYADGGILDGGWLLAGSLAALAGLHPSMAVADDTGAGTPQAALGTRRVALLATATLFPAAMLVVHAGRLSALEAYLIATGVIATTALAFVRMTLVFRAHARALLELQRAESAARVAEALELSHARFQAAARAIRCAIYEWDLTAGRTTWTDGLTLLFGWSPDEDDGMSDWFLDRVHPDDRDRVAAHVRSYLAGGDDCEARYRFRTADGGWRHVWDSWIVERSPAGTVERVTGGMLDVTEEVELEERLRQAEKLEAIGRLAGGVAHDFNNLLMAISGYSELAAARAKGDPQLGRTIGEIARAADRAAELTRQLLAYSRRQVLQTQVVDLAAVVAESTPLLQRLLGADVRVETLVDPATRPVRADPTQLQQVLMNLAVNARDAMPTGGRLLIEARPDGAESLLVVEDTGVGMDEATLERAFEPFFTTKPPGAGTGLGLATVYGIVRQSEGTISVTSAVGEGTRFEVRLAATAPEADAPAPEAAVRSRASGRVLLVEDEALVRDVLAEMLRDRGFEVVAAAGPDEALGLLPALDAIDLLITDVVMPGMDGRELARRLADERPGLRTLFVSGHPTRGEEVDGAPGAAFLQKPFRSEELLEKARELLGEPELAAESAGVAAA